MACRIYDPSGFSNKIEHLKKGGGKSQDAAHQAEAIIRELARSDQLSPHVSKKLTQYGEARLENGAKFDLGSGYRLLYVKKEGWYLVLFVGSHDECDTWLKNHRKFEADCEQGKIIEPEPEQPEDIEFRRSEERNALQEDTEPYLHEILDQQTIREIFKGLCGPSR